jgi:hypothetical protein
MPDLPPEFVVFLIFGGGLLVLCPLFYQAGKQAGLAEAPRRVIDFAPIYAQQTAPAPVELVRTEARTFTRLSWRRISVRQWRALLETTAEGKLCGLDKPFTKPELVELRDLWIKRGVAKWRDPAYPTLGWEFTPSMWRAIVRHCGGVPHRAGVSRVE